MPAPSLAGVSVYPVESAAGLPLDTRPVEARGLAGDRRGRIVRPEGRRFTSRERPRLVLVRAGLGEEVLLLDAPGRAPSPSPEPERPPPTAAGTGRRPRSRAPCRGPYPERPFHGGRRRRRARFA